MSLTLSEVPAPAFSDGTTAFYPDVYRSSRAPAGGYVECKLSRVQKYLELLTPVLRDVYERHPDRIPGVQQVAPAGWDGKTVVFRNTALLAQLPANYKMYESKKLDQVAADSATGSPAPVEVKKESEASAGKRGAGKAKPRADAYIFGHPCGSKFRSTTEFMPHLVWMVQDDTHKPANCLCKLCQNWVKAGGKSSARGKAIVPATESAPPDPPPPRELNPPKKRTSPKATLPLPSEEIAPGQRWEHERNSGLNTPEPESRNGTDGDDDDDRRSKDSHHAYYTKPASDDWSDPSAEAKYRQKYRELKSRIGAVEEENAKLEEEYRRAKTRLSRMKFERRLLFDRLQVVQGRVAPGISSSPDHSSDAAQTEIASPDDSGSPTVISIDQQQRRRPQPQQPSQPQTVDIKPPTEHKPSVESKPPEPTETKRTRKKREKKVVDPNAPKRPVNAFMFFCDHSREKLKKERGSMREADIKSQGLTNLTKALGMRWKALDADQRLEWAQKYRTDKKRYDTEMADYTAKNKKRKLSESAEPDAPSKDSDRQPQSQSPTETRGLDVPRPSHPEDSVRMEVDSDVSATSADDQDGPLVSPPIQ